MKNKLNLLWLIAVIGLVVMACDNGNNESCTHNWGEWTVTTEPTCSATGIGTRNCTDCGVTDTNTTVPKNDHHDWNVLYGTASTCSTLGSGKEKCKLCGKEVEGEGFQLDPYNHTFTQWQETTPPTCTTTAIDTEKCKDCPALGTETKTGKAALEHTGTVAAFAATCTKAGNSAALSGNCVRFAQCGHVVTGTVVPALGHDWKWAAYTSGIRDCQRDNCSGTVGIGDEGPAGGIIFYVVDSGFTVQGYGSSGDNGYFAQYTAYYLEAAPANASGSIMVWSNTNVLIPNLSQSSSATIDRAIGRGRLNTALIAAAHSADTVANNAAKAAAAYTNGGKDDWFLPSREELNQIYIQRSHVGITTGIFWSSSQGNISNAWNQNFDNGNQGFDDKGNSVNVRAIRAF